MRRGIKGAQNVLVVSGDWDQTQAVKPRLSLASLTYERTLNKTVTTAQTETPSSCYQSNEWELTLLTMTLGLVFSDSETRCITYQYSCRTRDPTYQYVTN